MTSIPNPLLAGSNPHLALHQQKNTGSVGLPALCYGASALIAFGDRHTKVCLSLVVKPAFRGFSSSQLSTNKKTTLAGGHFVGELGGIRTRDPLIKSQMLYRLSYELI